MGLHSSDIVRGYERSFEKATELLNGMVTKNITDLKNEKDILDAIRGPIDAKQYGYAASLSSLVARACIQTLPKNPKFFDVDNIRVIKILGGGIHDSIFIKGAALKGDVEGSIKTKSNA